MDCIPYINDLRIEINVLSNLNNDGKLDKVIQDKKELLDKCKYNLNQLSNNKIEYRLYLKILEGKKVTKAIEEIANENYEFGIKPTDISTIWSNYYKKIKKYL